MTWILHEGLTGYKWIIFPLACQETGRWASQGIPGSLTYVAVIDFSSNGPPSAHKTLSDSSYLILPLHWGSNSLNIAPRVSVNEEARVVASLEPANQSTLFFGSSSVSTHVCAARRSSNGHEPPRASLSVSHFPRLSGLRWTLQLFMIIHVFISIAPESNLLC